MKRRALLPLVGLIPLLAPPAFPHEAPLDGFGCHHSADQRSYECHRGLLATRTFASKAEMLRVLEGSHPPPGAEENSAELTLHSAKKEKELDQICIRENFTKQVLCGTPLK